MTTKRQQTMAKITRERNVREKREKKLEKKREKAAERKAKANGTWIAPDEPERRGGRRAGSRRRTAGRCRRRVRADGLSGRQAFSSIRISPTETIVRYWAKA